MFAQSYRTFIVLFFCFLLLLLLLSFVGKPENAQQIKSVQKYHLANNECWFDIQATRQIICGQLVVSESDSKPFQLPFVIIKDDSSDHQSDPLVYLPGGPGSSSSLNREGIEEWLDWISSTNFSRDLVLMDQRGTGLSTPQFRCRDYESYLRASLKENSSAAEDLQSLSDGLSNCIENFNQQDYSFSHFSSEVSAKDFQVLMQLLGYEQWNVMGASYGTRVAMVWAADATENGLESNHAIRSMILDSVYPPGKGGLLQWPETLEKSFQQAWAVCAESEHCQFNQQQLWQALDYLKDKPIELTISLWEGGWPLDVVVNDRRFLFAAYSALYRPSSLEKLSLAIEGIMVGDYSVLQQFVEASVNSDLDPEFNPFTFFMIDCAENYRPTQAEYDESRAEFSLFKEYTEQWVSDDVCQLFPKNNNFNKYSTKALAFKTQLTPILFLSGGLDPVTPARWIGEIKGQYPNAQTWLMPKLSHGVSANSDCVLSSLRIFLDDPTAKYDNPCLSSDKTVQ